MASIVLNDNCFDKHIFILYLIASTLSLICIFSIIFEYRRPENKVNSVINFDKYALTNVESLNKAIIEEKGYE